MSVRVRSHYRWHGTEHHVLLCTKLTPSHRLFVLACALLETSLSWLVNSEVLR